MSRPPAPPEYELRYPFVAEALKRGFPERYNVLPMAEAWKRLRNKEYFLDFEEGP